VQIRASGVLKKAVRKIGAWKWCQISFLLSQRKKYIYNFAQTIGIMSLCQVPMISKDEALSYFTRQNLFERSPSDFEVDGSHGSHETRAPVPVWDNLNRPPIESAREIRVLVLKSKDGVDFCAAGLSCQMQVLTLGGAPNCNPYFALSYVWGDPSDTKTISCCGGRAEITANLYRALLSIQKFVSGGK
jgi:hypothetical protein